MHFADTTFLLMGLGAIIVLIAWLPLVVGRLPFSLPMVCVLIGLGLHASGLLPIQLSELEHSTIPEHLNEAVLLIALMGAGLRLDRPFGWRRWASTWRLLGIAMPLTILGAMVVARALLGLPWPTCFLLGAVLAPTDPVLAADVQSGPPGEGERGEVRFALTSEAGLNDGLASPFVTLAILLAQPREVSWVHWAGTELLGGVVLGAVIGWLGGRAMGWAMFRVPTLRLAETGEGLAATGVALMAYATAKLLGANGFITVFATAVSLRGTRPDSKFHREMSSFAEQIERVLVMLVLVLLGWAVGAGLLQALTWREVLLTGALMFVLRPISAWLGFIASGLRWQPKALMAFFGMRGIGTLYYLQYALGENVFQNRDQLWAIIGFTVLASIVVHGIASTPLMRMASRKLDQREREALEEA